VCIEAAIQRSIPGRPLTPDRQRQVQSPAPPPAQSKIEIANRCMLTAVASEETHYQPTFVDALGVRAHQGILGPDCDRE